MSNCIFSCPKGKNSTFGVPKDADVLKNWEKSLGIPLKKSYRVCEIHFDPQDIINTWVSGQGPNKYTICLKRPRLKKGAVPKRPFNNSLESPSDLSDTFKIEIKSTSDDSVKHDHSYFINEPTIVDSTFTISPNITQSQSSTNDMSSELFELVLKNNSLINVPFGWFIDVGRRSDEMFICFHKLTKFRYNFVRDIEKQLILTKDLKIFLHVNGKAIGIADIGLQDDYRPNSIDDIENIIKLYNQIKVCQGSGSADEYPSIKSTLWPQFMESHGQWKHKKCTVILNNESTEKKCIWCKKLLYIIKKKKVQQNTKVFSSQKKKININEKIENKIFKNTYKNKKIAKFRQS